MTEHKKKNRTRDQVATQLISDPELGKVLTLAMPPPASIGLEEDTTPEPHRTTPIDPEAVLARLHGPVEHATTELSSLELDAVLKSSTPRSETLSLHRLPKDLEKARQEQETQHTEKWSKENITRLVDEAKARAHQTEQLSSTALGDLLAGEEHTTRVAEEVISQVQTVRWDKDSPVAKIVQAHEAAALLEISAKREDDEALLDVPEKHRTEQVSQEDLDRVLEFATKNRPRQGRASHEILASRAPEPPRQVALLEEKMPAIRKAPTGVYQSMMADTHQDTSSRDKLFTVLHVLIVLMVAAGVGALLWHMWPR